jgi:hypothetical protein
MRRLLRRGDWSMAQRRLAGSGIASLEDSSAFGCMAIINNNQRYTQPGFWNQWTAFSTVLRWGLEPVMKALLLVFPLGVKTGLRCISKKCS